MRNADSSNRFNSRNESWGVCGSAATSVIFCCSVLIRLWFSKDADEGSDATAAASALL